MAKEALLIIDMLNDFVRQGASLEVPDTRKAIPGIQREINRARTEGAPIIYICDTHEPDDKEFSKYGWPAHGVKGSGGADVIDELKPKNGDIVIHKHTYSAFMDTELDEILKREGITGLRITGCVTHICVLFTAYEAALRYYDISVVEDGIAGLGKEDHDAALRIMKSVLGVKLV